MKEETQKQRGGARAGAGRKPKRPGVKMVYATYYASEECVNRIKALAAKYGTSEGSVIDKATEKLDKKSPDSL